MKRLLLAFVAAFIPTIIYAQAPPPRVFLEGDARTLYNRSAISFRDDQANLRADRARAELGISATIPTKVKAKYSITTGYSNNDEIIPAGSFVVGSTELAKARTGGQSTGQTNTKPIALDWQVRPTHRIELTALSLHPELRPFFIARSCDINVSARTLELGSQQKTDSEQLNTWFWGVGGEIVSYLPTAHASMKIAASDKLILFDVAFIKDISPRGTLGLGFKHETLKLDRGTTARNSELYAQIGVVF